MSKCELDVAYRGNWTCDNSKHRLWLTLLFEAYREAAKRIAALEKEIAELNLTFDLGWAADMRAIEEWRKEDPEGRKLRLPDREKAFLWLCHEVVKRGTSITRLDEVNRELHEEISRLKSETGR